MLKFWPGDLPIQNEKLTHILSLTGRRKGPFGRQMGIISHSENPNHGYVQWMGLGYPLEIPYYFAAGQGNKVTHSQRLPTLSKLLYSPSVL